MLLNRREIDEIKTESYFDAQIKDVIWNVIVELEEIKKEVKKMSGVTGNSLTGLKS